jgi:hypothetical protein
MTALHNQTDSTAYPIRSTFEHIMQKPVTQFTSRGIVCSTFRHFHLISFCEQCTLSVYKISHVSVTNFYICEFDTLTFPRPKTGIAAIPIITSTLTYKIFTDQFFHTMPHTHRPGLAHTCTLLSAKVVSTSHALH